MEKRPGKRLGRFGWLVAASVALHLAVAAIFLVRLPTQTQPQPEEALNVDIVPPPEEKKPEEQQAQKAPEPPKKKAEQAAPPPPPPPPQQLEKNEGQPPASPPQEKVEKPPEPPKPEEQKPPEPPKEAKAEEPPKPAETSPEPPKPPEPPKEAKAEEPPKPEDKQPDPPPPPKQEEAQAQPAPPIPALRPVFQFGDKDQGPRKSPNGDAAEDASDPDGDAAAAASEAQGAQPPSSDKPSDKPDDKAQSASPVAKGINLPEVKADDVHSENDGSEAEGSGNVKASFAAEKKTDEQTPAKDGAKSGAKVAAVTPNGQTGSEPKLKPAKTLFSTQETSDPVATMSMDGVPRGTRFGMLCASELWAQLLHGTPSHRPIFLPKLVGGDGNVLDIGRAAFRDARGWYDVSIKCEVDSEATKVVSFSFGVGNPVPRSQWKSRGFPDE